jgi:hypothetical protein
MLDKIKRRVLRSITTLLKIEERLDDIKILHGKMIAEMNAAKKSKNIQDYEFKVFSQWGEDGILQKLIGCIDIRNKTFIEFGVEDFYESNCRFLLMNDNWSGFVIDGSASNIDRLRNSYFYWKYPLDSRASFITRGNINDILASSRLDHDLGILSIDIDGVDYFVFEAITDFRPRILIFEYNAVFGRDRKISVPYSDNFQRTESHYSNLYFGASLAALTDLANKRGYTLVGTNSTGINAFFIRNDLMNDSLPALDAQSAFTMLRTRESRDRGGKLTLVEGDDRIDLIKGLPIYNVETGRLETL